MFNDRGFEYDNDASFLREGIIDSMGVMELVTFVGATFGIQIDPKDVTVENFDSVNKLAGFIRRKGGAPAIQPPPNADAHAIPGSAAGTTHLPGPLVRS